MIHVGCSGFMYDHWKGAFYPEKLPKREWFSYYMQQFDSVELNVTFYRLPKKETFILWRDITPEGFVFALKGSRYISHVKRLSDVSDAVERFFERAIELEKKLSVVLWQFPPQFHVHRERLETFLVLLKTYKVKNVFEFRNETWISPEVESLLRDSGYCFCMADWPEFLRAVPLTSEYIYVRRHGHGGNYNTLYTKQELKKDARAIKDFIKNGGKDVFVYFNNDYKGYATQNALMLQELVH